MRLFIAVPITSEAKKYISDIISSSKTLQKTVSLDGGRLVPEHNWHFTLVFLGEQPEDRIVSIKDAMDETLSNMQFPSVVLKNIFYAPPGKKARMVWLAPDKNTTKNLGDIKSKLEEELKNKKLEWRQGYRAYNAHLTLIKFRPKPLSELPSLDCPELDFSYTIPQIELIKSTLKSTGAEYKTIYKISSR